MLVVVGVVFGGCRKENEDVAVTQTEPVQDKEFSEFIEYENSKLGFMLSYPKEWEHEETITKEERYVRFSPPQDQELYKYLSVYIGNDHRSLEELAKYHGTETEYEKVDDKTYVYRNKHTGYKNQYSSSFIKKNGDNFYIVSIDRSKEDNKALTTSLFDMVYQSFYAFEPDPEEIVIPDGQEETDPIIKNWKVYENEEYDFRVHYPGNYVVQENIDSEGFHVKIRVAEGGHLEDVFEYTDSELSISFSNSENDLNKATKNYEDYIAKTNQDDKIEAVNHRINATNASYFSRFIDPNEKEGYRKKETILISSGDGIFKLSSTVPEMINVNTLLFGADVFDKFFNSFELIN